MRPIWTGKPARKAKWLLVEPAGAEAADTDRDAPAVDPAGVDADSSGNAPWSDRALALPGAKLGRPAVSPQLATLRDHAPDGDNWLHEIKWDGYRLLASREGSVLKLQSRNAVDWTGRFAGVEAALRELPIRAVLIDAELVALNEAGYSEFVQLQAVLEGVEDSPISCVAFDLLAVDGVDLTGCRQLDRKLLLRDVLAVRPSRWLAYGEHIIGQGPRALARALADGHEGIVSKRIDAPYAAGRSQDWIKLKRRDGFEAIVVGFTLAKGSRRGVGALLLAVREPDGLRYVGRVGSGMDIRALTTLRARLDGMRAPAPVVAIPEHLPAPRGAVHWVRPRLVVEVEHRGRGKHGLLRHASFLRLRPDKPAGADEATEQSPLRRLTHPDRLVYPSPPISKRQVAEYYQAVAPWLLREVRGRPLSLLRAPEGLAGERFFQKHLNDGLGAGVVSLPIRGKSGRIRAYLAIENEEGLLSLVQRNTLEFHPWGVRPGEPDRPDRLTLDLDPGPGVDWKSVVRAARDIREHLEHAGLRSHALLSGGKGVHVVVPLDGRDGWAAVKRFARTLAHVLAEDAPNRFVAVASKAQRKGRIFVDWLRNGRGATSIAPWSLRARAGAPVAMPVDWSQLESSRGADDFGLDLARELTEGLGEHPWGDYRSLPQHLPDRRRAS